MRRKKLAFAGVVTVLLLGAAVSIAALNDSVRWRIEIFQRKVQGGLPDLHWSEVVSMTFGSDRFNLGGPILDGRSIDAAISNPYGSAEDVTTGGRIFRERCSACHGTDAGGGHAPSLLRATFNHGDSPFAIYRVLRDGVPSTAMIPTGLEAVQRWQVISYVTSLRRKALQGAEAEAPIVRVEVTPQDLVSASGRTDQWLTYSGTYAGWRYTRLKQITPGNASTLRPIWIRQFPGTGNTNLSTPLVVGARMFVTESPSNVVALDVRTGVVLWRYEHPLRGVLPLCCGAVNRGVAALGTNVYLATLDAHLIALDAATGSVKWDTRVANTDEGYTMTVAPLSVGRNIIVGVSGGEYGVRGFIAAYDGTTGKELWRFYTVPAPGERGSESWENDAWRSGGGGTWVTGSYDPELDLLYWGVGNPAPVYQGAARPGDNLFTGSVVALNASTGKLAWHFQFTPHDEHDWDASQTPVLADFEVGGAMRKLLVWPNRNGFYYLLDRTSGEFLAATPFAKQNWALRIDERGRPVLDSARRVTEAGVLTFPGVAGASNWQPTAFDPERRVVYVRSNDQASIFTNVNPDHVSRGERNIYVGSGAASSGPASVGVRAIEAATGKLLWERMQSGSRAQGGSSGLLASAGGVVFGAQGGYVFALDAANGHEVWSLPLGGTTSGPPISFELDGRQVVGIWAGQAYFLFGL